MREFKDRVAVITGAASGMGRAMAERFAREGMKVVLADVDPTSLHQTAAELRAGGATVLAVPADVSDGAAVEALAAETVSAFGAVHLVCNNAGVVVSRRTWEFTAAEWDWVLGVNLFGVIHGIRVFVPRMIEQGSEGHVVNTASVAGLVPFQGIAPYNVSKFGVVALSETLAQDLDQAGARVKVSVLCPGFVPTNLGATSARNRPGQAAEPPVQPGVGPLAQLMQEAAAAGLRLPLTPADVAEQVFAAVRDERFYILPHPGFGTNLQARTQSIVEGGRPHPFLPASLATANVVAGKTAPHTVAPGRAG